MRVLQRDLDTLFGRGQVPFHIRKAVRISNIDVWVQQLWDLAPTMDKRTVSGFPRGPLKDHQSDFWDRAEWSQHNELISSRCPLRLFPCYPRISRDLARSSLRAFPLTDSAIRGLLALYHRVNNGGDAMDILYCATLWEDISWI